MLASARSILFEFIKLTVKAGFQRNATKVHKLNVCVALRWKPAFIHVYAFKLEFHGTDAFILADLPADLYDTRAFPREDPREMSVRDARVYTCKRVQYTISNRVHVYKTRSI